MSPAVVGSTEHLAVIGRPPWSGGPEARAGPERERRESRENGQKQPIFSHVPVKLHNINALSRWIGYDVVTI